MPIKWLINKFISLIANNSTPSQQDRNKQTSKQADKQTNKQKNQPINIQKTN